jgi:hypothetical protein
MSALIEILDAPTVRPYIDREEDIFEQDDSGVLWQAAWACLGPYDVIDEDETWSAAARRVFASRGIVLVEPPIVTDEEDNELPDTSMSGDPEQVAKVCCWVKAE